MLFVSEINVRLIGGSEPFLITASDNSRWVLKFQNNPRGLRALVNEWICFSLAEKLKLPIPDFGLLDLPEALVAAEELPVFASLPVSSGGERVMPGLCFGTRYIENANQPGFQQMRRLTNGGTIAGVVVLDTWVGNWDRDSTNQNLLTTPSVSKVEWFDFHLIDYSVVIAGGQGKPAWQIGNLNAMATPIWFYGNNEDFVPYLKNKNDITYHLDILI